MTVAPGRLPVTAKRPGRRPTRTRAGSALPRPVAIEQVLGTAGRSALRPGGTQLKLDRRMLRSPAGGSFSNRQ